MSNKEFKSFDDYVSSLDQTIPVRVVDESSEGISPQDIPKTPSVSPKRGRPPKSTQPQESSAPPKPSKPPAAPKNDAMEQKLYGVLVKYKSSPVFAARLEHIKIHEKMSMAELLEAQKQIKSVISLQFNRAIVEKLFCKSVDFTETFMVQYLQWDHCRGISDDILSPEGIEEFQDELEELSMDLSTKYQPGALVRLVTKVAVAIGSAVQERTQLIGNQPVNIPVKDSKSKSE